MSDYPFDLLGHPDRLNAHQLLQQRHHDSHRDLEKDAVYYDPDEGLKIAINTALALGEPLLLTGDTGTGKTQTAYYVAEQLGLGKVLHFQVKSNSAAQDVLYRFDHVKYYRDGGLDTKSTAYEIKRQCINEGVLWKALIAEKTRVVLIDEIDKAPRDFPNDLLHEIDQMKFDVPELNNEIIGGEDAHQPVVIITSNSERRLPDAFLRRCIFHHIEFNEKLLRKAITAHKHEFVNLSSGFIDLAVNRFADLRKKHLRKTPATGEFLAWLRVLALLAGTDEEQLKHALLSGEKNLQKLPYLGVLLKNREDMRSLKNI